MLVHFSQSAEIGGDDAQKFKSEVLTLLKIADAVKYGLIALGGFLILCVIGIVVVARLRREVRP